MKNILYSFLPLLIITQTYSQWTQQLLPSQVDVWGLANKDSIVFAGTEIGFQAPGYVFRSTDFGVTWDTLTGLPYAGGWSFAFSDSVLIAGSFGWGIYLSSDLGNTWTVPDSGIASNENVHQVLKHKSYVFAATVVSGNGILRSSDNGRRWIAVNTGLPVTSYLSLAANGNDIYAGTAFTGEVFRSTDDGMNWFSASNGLPINSMVASLAARDTNVYAGLGSGGGVYFSSDNGSSWNFISSSVSINQVWTLTLEDTSLIVGSIGSGVFLTQDNGISWTPVNEGLINLNIRSLLVTADNYLFAGTTNGFVCYRHLSEIITDAGKETDQPLAFNLSQCYPNPFNPGTIISWQVPAGSNQTIKVYDILGNEIATLVDEYRPAGRYEVEFDAGRFSSGVYFYQLRSPNFVETKKMLLMK